MPRDLYILFRYIMELHHKIEINQLPSNGKGNIWMNPLKNKVKIDLNEKKWKNAYLMYHMANSKRPPLTLAFTNATKNTKFAFKYNKRMNEVGKMRIY